MDHSSKEIFKKQKNCNIQERWFYKLPFHQLHLLIKRQRKIKPNDKWNMKLNHLLTLQSSHTIIALDIFNVNSFDTTVSKG